jgi:hypothetical protein
VTEFIGKIFSTIGKFLAPIAKMVAAVGSAIGNLLGSVFRPLLNILTVIFDWLGKLLDKLAEFADSEFGKLLAWMVETITGAINEMAGAIEKVLSLGGLIKGKEKEGKEKDKGARVAAGGKAGSFQDVTSIYDELAKLTGALGSQSVEDLQLEVLKQIQANTAKIGPGEPEVVRK